MAADAPPLGALARAKVNLTLHVLGRREDGYHELESLVVFPRLGDYVEVEPAAGLSLSIDGPFAAELGAGDDNLVLRAAAALRDALGAASPWRAGAAIHLTKRLPIASGVGGGSSDAAATLLLLARLWGAEDAAATRRMSEIALDLGADVPACLAAPRPLMMRGIGERLAAAPALPEFALCLVNPGVQVSTGAVFQDLAGAYGAPMDAPPERFVDLGDFAAWLAAQGNDLEAPARRRAPLVETALGALRAQPACRLARMSGSGATCWGLFEDEAGALRAAEAIAAAQPGWWCAAAGTGS